MEVVTLHIVAPFFVNTKGSYSLLEQGSMILCFSSSVVKKKNMVSCHSFEKNRSNSSFLLYLL